MLPQRPLLSSRLLFRPLPATLRPFTSSHARFNANPGSAQNQPSSFKEGLSRYKILTGPFSKVFLGAIFTYQVLYWCWLKLEMSEEKAEKNKEVAALESKARELTGKQK